LVDAIYVPAIDLPVFEELVAQKLAAPPPAQRRNWIPLAATLFLGVMLGAGAFGATARLFRGPDDLQAHVPLRLAVDQDVLPIAILPSPQPHGREQSTPLNTRSAAPTLTRNTLTQSSINVLDRLRDVNSVSSKAPIVCAEAHPDKSDGMWRALLDPKLRNDDDMHFTTANNGELRVPTLWVQWYTITPGVDSLVLDRAVTAPRAWSFDEHGVRNVESLSPPERCRLARYYFEQARAILVSGAAKRLTLQVRTEE
jgi:hypothetical protein